MVDLSPFAPLSLSEATALRLLARGARYGLELVEHSDGRLRRGTVYNMLARLEDRGLIVSREEPPMPEQHFGGRRVYALTEAGCMALRVAPIRHEQPLARFAQGAALGGVLCMWLLTASGTPPSTGLLLYTGGAILVGLLASKVEG
jgi:DNA-binding PadR family transcriptional regulator